MRSGGGHVSISGELRIGARMVLGAAAVGPAMGSIDPGPGFLPAPYTAGFTPGMLENTIE